MMIKFQSILTLYLAATSHAFAPAAIHAPTRNNAHKGTITRLYSEVESDDRRSLLVGGALTIAAAILFLKKFPAPVPPPDFKAVAADISALVTEDPNRGPTLVRLAWHSCGTYDRISRTGGSGTGTTHFKKELDHGSNAGLEVTAVSWLEPIKQKYGEGLSYADLYTLAGVVAIKTLEGPTIPWRYGRPDAVDPSSVTPDGRLPKADSGPPGAGPEDAAHLREIFGRMGFDDKEIVTLSGAHALGRCNTAFSGYDGPWTATPVIFNNLYYRFLTGLTWVERQWDGPFQYANQGSQNFMMLPTDFILLEDKAFKSYVDMYAEDQAKFFEDFSAAFQKLEELGTSNLKTVEWA